MKNVLVAVFVGLSDSVALRSRLVVENDSGGGVEVRDLV